MMTTPVQARPLPYRAGPWKCEPTGDGRIELWHGMSPRYATLVGTYRGWRSRIGDGARDCGVRPETTLHQLISAAERSEIEGRRATGY